MSSCHRYHPAEVERSYQSGFDLPCCLRPLCESSTFGIHSRGHLCVHFRYGPTPRRLPFGDAVGRLHELSLPLPCYPSYKALIITLAGLSPAGHSSLCWTHAQSSTVPKTFTHGSGSEELVITPFMVIVITPSPRHLPPRVSRGTTNKEATMPNHYQNKWDTVISEQCHVSANGPYVPGLQGCNRLGVIPWPQSSVIQHIVRHRQLGRRRIRRRLGGLPCVKQVR